MASQRQSGGDNSVNVLAGGIHIGVSVAEVRQIASDLFDSNIPKLQGVAKAVAEERAEALNNSFLLDLYRRAPQALHALADPGVQFSLFTAQRDQARRGEDSLETTLVDLLVDRCTATTGSLAAIVLDEAIATAGKLTHSQFAALSVAWYLQQTVNTAITTVESHAHWISRHLMPFVPILPTHNSSYDHLAYTGSATLSPVSQSLGSRFSASYPGVYSGGVPLMNLAAEGLGLEAFSEDTRLFVPAERNAGWLRVVMEGTSLPAYVGELGLSEDQEAQLGRLAVANNIGPSRVLDELRALVPDIDELRKAFEETGLARVQPTSVGTAIAHANARRVTGVHPPLSVWITE